MSYQPSKKPGNPRVSGITALSAFTALTEPSTDAEPWAWSAYFDDQLRLIRDDLRAEGASLAKLEALRKRKISADEREQREFNACYLREIEPAGVGPCAKCSDRVRYRLDGQTLWRCRSCDRRDAGLKVRWLVTPAGRAAGTCAHCNDPIHAGDGCTQTMGGAVLHNKCVDGWSRA